MTTATFETMKPEEKKAVQWFKIFLGTVVFLLACIGATLSATQLNGYQREQQLKVQADAVNTNAVILKQICKVSVERDNATIELTINMSLLNDHYAAQLPAGYAVAREKLVDSFISNIHKMDSSECATKQVATP